MADEQNLNEHMMTEPVGMDSYGIGKPFSDNTLADGNVMKKFMESLNEVFSDGYVAMSEDMKHEGEMQAARSLILGSEFSVDEYMENMGNNLVYADPQQETGNQAFSLASVEAMRNQVEPVELLAARKGMSVSEFVTQDLMEKVQDYVDYERELSGNSDAVDNLVRNFVNARSSENYANIDEYLQSDEFAEYAKQYGEAVEAQCAENHGLSHEEYKEVYPDIMKDKLGDEYGMYGGRDSEAFNWSNYKFSDEKDMQNTSPEADGPSQTIEWNEKTGAPEPSEKVNHWDKQMDTPEESEQVDWNTTKDVEDSGETLNWNETPSGDTQNWNEKPSGDTLNWNEVPSSPDGSDADHIIDWEDTKAHPVSEFVALKPTKIEQLGSPEADGTQADSPKVKIKLKDPELGDTENGTTIHVHSTGPDLTHDVAHPHIDPAFNGGEMEKMLAGMRDSMKSTQIMAAGLAAATSAAAIAGNDKDKGADGPSPNSIGMDLA